MSGDRHGAQRRPASIIATLPLRDAAALGDELVWPGARKPMA
jgi:hypothetical protein